MADHTELIHRFYTAFQEGNAEAMAACYHQEVEFEDPVFRKLKGEQAGDMWRMLLSRAKDLTISYSHVESNASSGAARWEAQYTFGKTGRAVQNKIQARFHFQDDLIIKHVDHFNFWKWSRMALGPIGLWLGATPLLRNKVSKQSRELLEAYRKSKAAT